MALFAPPNRATFPGGRPGINLSHPASEHIRASVVATGANSVISPMGNGVSFASAPGSSPSWLGPGVSISGTNAVATTCGANAAIGYLTVAAIFKTDSSFANYQSIVGFPGQNTALLITQTTGVVYWYLNGTTVTSSITLATSTPYFIAVTTNVSGNVTNFVVRNLQTGKILTSTVASSAAAGFTSVTFANYVAGPYPLGGAFHAGMAGSARLYLGELLAWAQDPWSFWYPQTATQAIFAGLRSQIAPVITGALSATEATDTASFSGLAGALGSIAATETADSAGISGSVAWTATLNTTENADTAALSGLTGISGAFSAAEPTDTAAFSASVTISGALAATEATDTARFTEGPPVIAAPIPVSWYPDRESAARKRRKRLKEEDEIIMLLAS